MRCKCIAAVPIRAYVVRRLWCANTVTRVVCAQHRRPIEVTVLPPAKTFLCSSVSVRGSRSMPMWRLLESNKPPNDAVNTGTQGRQRHGGLWATAWAMTEGGLLLFAICCLLTTKAMIFDGTDGWASLVSRVRVSSIVSWWAWRRAQSWYP